MECPVEQVTAQGFDMQFGTNVIGTELLISLPQYNIIYELIGHWYLAERLMPALLAVAQENPSEKARVITTSSGSAYMDNIHWDTIEDTPQRRKTGSFVLYNRSKHVSVVCDGLHARLIFNVTILGQCSDFKRAGCTLWR
jgi:retinol dehydrogenase 12